MTCHPQHYTQWSGSMHAYSSDDPVFLAMNARGQRETNNQLGTFCVQCHAPMAVALKLTDGTNFDPTTLPPTARGITCFFCHNVESVDADHNNGLVLALDDTMRGGVQNPDAVENTATLMEFNSGTYELDAGATLTVTLNVSHGMLTLGTTSGLMTINGNGTGMLTLIGTTANLNAALNTQRAARRSLSN